MKEVTKQKFYAVMGQLDVLPDPEPQHTVWKHRVTREVLGRSTPGYLMQGKESFFAVERLLQNPYNAL